MSVVTKATRFKVIVGIYKDCRGVYHISHGSEYILKILESCISMGSRFWAPILFLWAHRKSAF
jgi:hypothetical protein